MIGITVRRIIAPLQYKRSRTNLWLNGIFILIVSITINQAVVDVVLSKEDNMQCEEIDEDIKDIIRNIPNENFSQTSIEEIFSGDNINDIAKNFYAYYLMMQPDMYKFLSPHRDNIDIMLEEMPNYLILESINSRLSHAKIVRLIDMMKSGVFSCGGSDKSPFLEKIRFLAVEEGIENLDRMPILSEAAKVDARMLEEYIRFLKYLGNWSYLDEAKKWKYLSANCTKTDDRDECISEIRKDLTRNLNERRRTARKDILCNIMLVRGSKVYSHNVCEN